MSSGVLTPKSSRCSKLSRPRRGRSLSLISRLLIKSHRSCGPSACPRGWDQASHRRSFRRCLLGPRAADLVLSFGDLLSTPEVGPLRAVVGCPVRWLPYTVRPVRAANLPGWDPAHRQRTLRRSDLLREMTSCLIRAWVVAPRRPHRARPPRQVGLALGAVGLRG